MAIDKLLLGTAAGLLLVSACAEPEENQTGSEYMPDMAHSIAYEANTYFDYYQNTWDDESVKDKYALAKPGTPVKGTVPRGYAGYYFAGQASTDSTEFEAQVGAMREVYGMTGKTQTIATPVNGKVPYYYVDTEADRLRAIEDLRRNPFPITVDGLKRGAELYNIFCAICHGENGGGNGWIYENGAYPAAPRNFLEQSWVDTSAGTYYHAMMYGKNVMGAYYDKMSYEERWQVIHHIRALQAAELGGTYTENENTLVTPAEATPIGTQRPIAAAFFESMSREPIEVESQESDAPEVVGGPAPGEQPQLGETNPTAVLDSLPEESTGDPLHDQMESQIDDGIE